MTEEKAVEYMQVAGIVCLELDILAESAERDDLTLDQLRRMVKRGYENKERAINDAAHRAMRWNALKLVFSAAAAGRVQSSDLRDT
jgi:hypothetical protein